MGAPPKSQNISTSPAARSSPNEGRTRADSQIRASFPHDYIRANGYTLPQDEEQTICTVYLKTPSEQQKRLRDSLTNYIDWRCTASESEHHRFETSASSLNLCNHISKGPCWADATTLSEYADVLGNDGIIRLDLLWQMRWYRKWFDATPGTFANQIPA